jgi:hypothetical protein
LVASTGTGRLGIRGRYEVLDAAGEVACESSFAPVYVLRGTQKWMSAKIEKALPAGSYRIRLTLEDVHLTEPLAAETQVDWPTLDPSASASPAASPRTTSNDPQTAAKDEPADSIPKDGAKP